MDLTSGGISAGKPTTMRQLLFPLFILLLIACGWNDDKKMLAGNLQPSSLQLASDIEVPKGYKRITVAKDSFGEWLRSIQLKKDKHVYLYNGALKENQSAQFVVLNIPVGDKDLQQCADAVMRLRAEYLFKEKKYSSIEFRDNTGKSYKWNGGDDRPAFEQYLQTVFGWCGTASLEKQLKKIAAIKDIQPGDVFIKGGFPGHAMIVMDVAANDKGEKIFMLAQSYMPAQDIHIVKNPGDDQLSPWYKLNDSTSLVTPEWIFQPGQLRTW